MKQVPALQVRSSLDQLLDCVATGEEIAITRHGKVIASLTGQPAAARSHDIESVTDTNAAGSCTRLRRFRKGQFRFWIEAIGGGTEVRFINRLFGLYA
jgi:antitoxin (DNA-binding transcriptional repressor) of toxin-antitoxin stability system